MSRAAAEGRLGVALVDLTGGERRSAMINGDRMFCAASLRKIAILLGAFEAIDQGQVTPTPRLCEQMTQMIRVSDNAAATAVLETVGFPAVARALLAPAYRLYEPQWGGGFWSARRTPRNATGVAIPSHSSPTPRRRARRRAFSYSWIRATWSPTRHLLR